MKLHVASCLTLLFTSTSIAQSLPDFELSGPVKAASYLPQSLMTGPSYDVQSLAYADGLQISYRIQTSDDIETIIGTQSLAARIREINAIFQLRQMNKSEEFTKALRKAGEEKLDSVVGLVKDPVNTVKRIPQGASRFFGRISNAVQNAGQNQGENGAKLQSILGVTRKKAELAIRLGVSPYTTDPVLQNELQLAARAMAGGALVVNLAGAAVDGGAGAALQVIGINQTLQRALVESTPEELQVQNRIELTSLKVPTEDINALLNNPWFSPWQETLLTYTLKDLHINPSLLVNQAAQSQTEQDARYFVQLALLYKKYHQDTLPLVAFRKDNGILCALDTKGTLVIAVAADLIQWSATVKSRADEFTALITPEGPVRAISLITDGAISPIASSALTQLNITNLPSFLGPVQ
jgi:hypothetical protein